MSLILNSTQAQAVRKLLDSQPVEAAITWRDPPRGFVTVRINPASRVAVKVTAAGRANPEMSAPFGEWYETEADFLNTYTFLL